MKSVELGLGLIGIGREWGNIPSPIPNETEATEFLKKSVDLGILFLDTAPAYGSSEKKLGIFLKTLSDGERQSLTVSTKFGEHWDENNNQSYVDHSYEALCRSIDKSINILGKIDLLQLHKSNPDVLISRDFFRSLDYARKKGIFEFGASVSDLISGEIAIRSKDISVIQIPFNESNQSLEKLIDLSIINNKTLIINRPFNSGKNILPDTTKEEKKITLINSFRFILKKPFYGFILTGTTSIDHLKENIEAFNKAKEEI
ncbi:MAG: aldo/keto reductase [Candidatus Shapirobacteria bacterium]|nr:aldo/keto reductase [Candidatus Shapirobacteria bacterium]MDD3002359.1 aldo/keto reductase [Candidatus Shapirobacteria bacterium]MDD4383333.1 aldo/keto reductase [Candidatus Shapirobacteria bacterium]